MTNFRDSMGILNDLQPSSKDGKAITSVLTAFFQDFLIKIDDMFSEIKSEFSAMSERQGVKTTKLEHEVEQLKKHVMKLEEKIEDNDSYERRDTLVLSGSAIPPVSNMESCPDIVCKLVKDSLKVNISTSDISVSHRLSPKSSSQRTPKKDIIVKFCRRNTKLDVLNSCRKSKPNNLFVNEFLTPSRQTIAYVLRKAKKEFPHLISGSTSFDGKVFAWIKPPNPHAAGAKDLRVEINTHSKLENFCSRTLERPLTHFIQEWTH